MRRPTLLVLALVALLAAGCGDDDTSDVTTSPDGTGEDPGAGVVVADLEITVTEGETDQSGRTAVLECTESGATGALWLDGEQASEACEALRDPAVRLALEPPPPDQVCTEVYGGPSVATIVGTVDGDQVDAVVDRADGCGIARWEVLSALLPEPVGA